MCWNSKRHNDHNYFAISGHSASQKYVTSPSVASKSILNLLIKSHQNHHNNFVTTWSSSSGETWKGRWRSWTCWRARSCCSCMRRMTTGGAKCASSLNSKSLIPQRENFKQAYSKLFFGGNSYLMGWNRQSCGRFQKLTIATGWDCSFPHSGNDHLLLESSLKTANCSQSLPH